MNTVTATIRLADGRDVRRMTLAEIEAEYQAIRADCPFLIREDRARAIAAAVGDVVSVDRRRAPRR